MAEPATAWPPQLAAGTPATSAGARCRTAGAGSRGGSAVRQGCRGMQARPPFARAERSNAVRQLASRLRAEALAVSVLPRTARLDSAAPAPRAAIHSRTAMAANSGPFSNLMRSGTSRRTIGSGGTSITFVDLGRRSGRIATRSRVNPLIRLRIRNLLPSRVRYARNASSAACSGNIVRHGGR